jgi:hypothetical protein
LIKSGPAFDDGLGWNMNLAQHPELFLGFSIGDFRHPQFATLRSAALEFLPNKIQSNVYGRFRLTILA